MWGLGRSIYTPSSEWERERERVCAQATVVIQYMRNMSLREFSMTDKRRRYYSAIAGNPIIDDKSLIDTCWDAFRILHIGTYVLNAGDTIVSIDGALFMEWPLACAKLDNPTDTWLFHGTKFQYVKDCMHSRNHVKGWVGWGSC